jgi:hypothetical protein
VSTTLECHFHGCNLYFKAAITHFQLEYLTGLDPKLVPEGFRHYDTPSGINGSFHGITLPQLIPGNET